MSESSTTTFLRPGKVFLLVLIGVLVYLVALVSLVPAGWLWHHASPHVPLPPEINVEQVSGKLWQGAAGAVVAGFPVRLGWQLGWPSVSTLHWPLEISITTSQSSLQGDVILGWSGHARVEASGTVDVSEFEGLIRRSGGAVIEGDVTIDQLNLAWNNDTLSEARGLARWAGGQVSWPMGDRMGQAEFPPMLARLDTAGNGVSLVVEAEGGDGPAADAEIRWNGMMDVRVYKRMVDLAGQPWSGSARPGDVVFRVNQPLLPGGSF